MIPSTLVLTRSEVASLLTLSECIQAVEAAFRAEAEGQVPRPEVMGFHVQHGGFHIKAAGMGPHFATKVNANFPGNPARHGLPTVQGIVVLCDADVGTPLALMDSIEITAQRTAAASAVAARQLARLDASVAAVIGCGVQAAYQLEAVSLVRRLERVFVVDQDEERRDRFAQSMNARLGISVIPSELEAAVANSSIVLTCTTSRRAFLTRDMLREGTFVAAVGADNPEKQEIDPGLMAASRVVVDNMEQCRTIGDLHHAVALGLIQHNDVIATLGEVLAGLQPGRSTAEEIVIFDSTGTALQDVAAAVIVYQKALKENVGRRISFSS
jgi:alanine dehydrogenase